jgi:hypothetical protein
MLKEDGDIGSIELMSPSSFYFLAPPLRDDLVLSETANQFAHKP